MLPADEAFGAVDGVQDPGALCCVCYVEDGVEKEGVGEEGGENGG